MNKYDDIINLEHYHDSKRPYMPAENRAAQFMPFKSLSPHEGSIKAKEDEINAEEWQTIIEDCDIMDLMDL